MNRMERWRSSISAACVLVAGLFLLGPLCGCLVGGYSSGGGGFFIWPGSIVLTILLLLFFFMRRGR